MKTDQQMEIDDIDLKLKIIRDRLQAIADEEANAALAGSHGLAARGFFERERDTLLKNDIELLVRKAALESPLPK